MTQLMSFLFNEENQLRNLYTTVSDVKTIVKVNMQYFEGSYGTTFRETFTCTSLEKVHEKVSVSIVIKCEDRRLWNKIVEQAKPLQGL